MPNLTGITALDVGIGLAFIYLLFSLLCTALMEAISGVLDLRAATLEKGLRNLLDDDGAAGAGGAPTAPIPGAPQAAPNGHPLARRGDCVTRLSDELLGHGLIRTQYRASKLLRRRKRRGPSYLEPRMFAAALLDVMAPQSRASDPVANVQTMIENTNIPQGTKNALLALAKDAGGNRDNLRKLVEEWFDGGMGRVSGWYKRQSQIIVCVLSLAVAVGLNVNTIAIVDRLVRDDVVRATVVTEATKAVETQAAPKSTPGSPPAGESVPTTDSLNAVADRIGKVGKLGVPIGWNLPEGDPAHPDLKDHFGRTFGGWLITFLALSLGAPFWFDALSRLSALRNAGAKPKADTPAAKK